MIDLSPAAVVNNPYPAYARIRDTAAAVAGPSGHTWHVGRYDDVLNVLRDSECFSNNQRGLEATLTGGDGTVHRTARKLLQPPFSAARLAELSGMIEDIALTTVRAQAGRRTCDFVTDLASPLPTEVLCSMLGDVRHQAGHFQAWSDAILSAGNQKARKGYAIGWRARVSALFSARRRSRLKTVQALIDCRAFLRQHFTRSDIHQNGGWLSTLLADALTAGTLTEDQLVDIGMLFVAAATETTTSTISSAGHLLATQPALREKLRSSPELVNSFIEEMLRYEAPIQRRVRYATQDVLVGDVPIQAGDVVIALIGSANRDPRHFDRPDEFIIDRQPNRHLSFGAGPHFCLGAELARMEAQAMLRALVSELPAFSLTRPDQALQYSRHVFTRAPLDFRVSFVA